MIKVYTMPSGVFRGKVVLTVNARVADRELHGGGGHGEQRRTDFGSLATALRADVIDWDSVDRNSFMRVAHRKLGSGPVAAVQVFLRRKRYDAIWCFTEVEGLLLALLFKLFRTRRVLFIIGVETLSPKPIFLLKRLKVWTHFTAILPTNSYQANELSRTAHIPEDKIVVLPYQVDCNYFSRNSQDEGRSKVPYVVAAGLESRDYTTLVKAVEDIDVELKLTFTSLWSGRKTPIIAPEPPKITIGSYSYSELRQLYAGAALAVVPLYESPYQHGITALQEAMAMGLPVIVTRTTGQSDVVIDRRSALRSNPRLKTNEGFARSLAPNRPELQESNGFYVGVGDVEAMKKCICYLLENRAVASELGQRARRFAQEVLSIELFVERAIRLLTTACDGQKIHKDILSGIRLTPESVSGD